MPQARRAVTAPGILPGVARDPNNTQWCTSYVAAFSVLAMPSGSCASDAQQHSTVLPLHSRSVNKERITGPLEVLL